MNAKEKYGISYFMPPEVTYDWVKKETITEAPIWCSVDLRDGNQALIEPMGLQEKLEYFKMLVDIGFKEIEVGFPAASDTEYQFARALIENKMIPQDVTIQVLTQAREHIIKKTFEALKGAPHAIVHLYNSTSVAQREQVFRKSKEEVKTIAIEGAKLLKKLADETILPLNTALRASLARRWIMPWRYVMQYWMYGSRPRITKLLLIFLLLCRLPCLMCLPARLNTYISI